MHTEKTEANTFHPGFSRDIFHTMHNTDLLFQRKKYKT